MKINHYFLIASKQMRNEGKKIFVDVVISCLAIIMVFACIMLYGSIQTYQKRIENQLGLRQLEFQYNQKRYSYDDAISQIESIPHIDMVIDKNYSVVVVRIRKCKYMCKCS